MTDGQQIRSHLSDEASCCVQGFPSQHAHRALTATHDCGTEAALSWLVENADKLDQEPDEQQHNISSQSSEGPSTGEHSGSHDNHGIEHADGMSCTKASLTMPSLKEALCTPLPHVPGVSSQPDPSTTVPGTPAVLGVPPALTVLHPDGSAEACRLVGLDCKVSTVSQPATS